MARYSPDERNPSNRNNSLGPAKRHSFPADADSWTVAGSAPHTMQIFATERPQFTESMKATGQAAYDRLKTLFNEFSGSFAEANTFLGGVGSGAWNSFGNELTRQEDRNLEVERLARISGIVDGRRLNAVFTFYMPSPIIFPLDNEYEEFRLTEKVGGILGSTISSALQVGAGVGALAGYAVNPKVEILFRNTNQRKFQFEFKFHPASEAESNALRKALNDLRKYASPTRFGTNGIIWKAPDTFDIVFLHNGKENQQIPRISECVLETMEIDYTPTATGWTTFTNGHPVTTRVVMNFRELEPIDRNNIGSPLDGGRGF